jgi:hypothetical protein
MANPSKFELDFSFEDSPVAGKFFQSNKFITAILGPVGAGKSVACVMKLFRHALMQHPDKDGIARTRVAVIRNTNQQLMETSAKTLFSWLPPERLGNWLKTEKRYIITPEKLGMPVEIEILYLPLDSPEDIQKLLSLELSFVWINEFREIDRSIFEGLQHRVGRYPKKSDISPCDSSCWRFATREECGDRKREPVCVEAGDPCRRGPTWHGLIMDSNPPDAESDFYQFFEEYVPFAWCCLENVDHPPFIPEDANNTSCPICKTLKVSPYSERAQQFRQPSGFSDAAENKSNLPAGYYGNMAANKAPEWTKVYCDAEYGYTLDGKPVHPGYKDSIHVAKEAIRPIVHSPIIAAFDFGRTPACALMQLTPRGRLIIFKEFTTQDMSIKQLCTDVIVPYLKSSLPGFSVIGVGDPAGNSRTGSDDLTAFMQVYDSGIEIQPAGLSNSPLARREALGQFFRRNIDGKEGPEPAILVDPSCKMLRKGLAGEFKYRKMKVAGTERYEDAPTKNLYSHICEAAEYGAFYLEKPVETRRRDGTYAYHKGSRKAAAQSLGYF